MNYKNGTVKVYFGHKRKYTSLARELGPDTVAFYVIRSTLCGSPSDFIKIGKTTDVRRRFAGYARMYSDKFDILHLRYFRKSNLDTAYEQGLGRRIVDFSGPFESRVKTILKQTAKPLRSDSDEIFAAGFYDQIKQAVAQTASENDQSPTQITRNRRSKRLQTRV